MQSLTARQPPDLAVTKSKITALRGCIEGAVFEFEPLPAAESSGQLTLALAKVTLETRVSHELSKHHKGIITFLSDVPAKPDGAVSFVTDNITTARGVNASAFGITALESNGVKNSYTSQSRVVTSLARLIELNQEKASPFSVIRDLSSKPAKIDCYAYKAGSPGGFLFKKGGLQNPSGKDMMEVIKGIKGTDVSKGFLDMYNEDKVTLAKFISGCDFFSFLRNYNISVISQGADRQAVTTDRFIEQVGASRSHELSLYLRYGNLKVLQPGNDLLQIEFFWANNSIFFWGRSLEQSHGLLSHRSALDRRPI